MRRVLFTFRQFFFLSVLLLSAFIGIAHSETLQLEAVSGGDKPIGTYVPPTVSTKIELKGSRDETLPFLIKLKNENCVTLSLEKSTATDPLFPLNIFEMPYVHTSQASFPGAYVGSHHDPLLPLPSHQFCPSDAGKGTTKIANWHWLYGEIKIPKDTPASDYTIKLIASGKGMQKSMNLQLRVWKMLLPETPAVALSAEYSAWYGVLGHYGKYDHQIGQLAEQYTREMREHRIQPLKLWVKVPEVTKAETHDSLAATKTVSLNLDDHAEPKSAFRDLAITPKGKADHVDFPKPIGLALADEENYWRGVQKAIIDNQLQRKAFVYLWDEPQKSDYPAIIKLGLRVRALAPDLKIMVTTSGYSNGARIPELEKVIDIYVPILNDWGNDFNSPKMKVYQTILKDGQKQGKELWTYLSCMSHGCTSAEESGLPDWVLDRPSVSIRSMAWIATKMNLTHLLYYNVDYAYQFYPKKDVWRDQWYFTGNGDGTLFYPGRPGEHGLQEHMPIDSLRLKEWRESSYDAEYIHWMNALKSPPAWWNREYSALVKSPKNWSKDYSKYQALRDHAGDYLNSVGLAK
jgi:hypothetical protein